MPVLTYAEARCPHCLIISRLSWAGEDAGWRTFQCWNCKKWLSRAQLQAMTVPVSWWIIADPSPLQVRQAVRIYKGET